MKKCDQKVVDIVGLIEEVSAQELVAKFLEIDGIESASARAVEYALWAEDVRWYGERKRRININHQKDR